ncbi:ABC transporter permease subunit [Kordiimonas sp. SCSIO 12610]|uniref:ABC transporter permease subunit n=1 Tax=Kordiimonas sp. SCSIO 12610 TaxID=2829597 RepID=UPI00210B5A1B|nr:ABC transporter permease subunit [Kordiimonas sp. SCSIO 12610]UTW55723.1 ABC transporter permease subunit [Kordiimonas sp. SCSIO 12610]
MNDMMTVFRREFSSYFKTPLAYVFLVLFLVMQGLFTFYMGQFFEREQADLLSFFTYHPWLYLFFMPAIAMRLWSEERKSGTQELLLTLPLSTGMVVIGKYLAALAFAGVALILTFPIWITVNWLGTPDNGPIITGYIGSLLMAASYLAIGAAISSMTRNQVIAFVLTVTVCFFFLASGLPIVLNFFEGWVSDAILVAIANLSFLTHFDNLQKGVISLADVFYFVSVITLWLFINRSMIELKREEG